MPIRFLLQASLKARTLLVAGLFLLAATQLLLAQNLQQLLQNTGFETGTLTGWKAGGVLVPTVTTAKHHTGSYSALLGSNTVPEQNGDSWLYQTVTIPSSASGASLNFYYWGSCADSLSNDWQESQIQNTSGTKLAQVMKVCDNSQTWKKVYFNLLPYKGQTIRVYFNSHGNGNSLLTYMYLDDVTVSVAGVRKWVQGYYANWQEAQYPPNRIDYSAITHITLVHWLTNSDGTIQMSEWDSTCGSVVSSAHAAGVKVIMMLGGSDDSNFASAASPSHVATLVSSIESKINACAMDGVDLDWETNINNNNFITLASDLRSANAKYIITAPIDPTVNPASLAAGLSAYCDHVSMMTYGNANRGSGWQSWYFSALAGDGTTHPESVTKWVTRWLAAGVPSAKLGVGIGFYSVGWTSPVTGALQNSTGATIAFSELPYGWSLAAGGGLLGCYYNQTGGSYGYDPSPNLNTEPSTPPQQPQISAAAGLVGPTCSSDAVTWLTFEDEASIAAKTNYINQNGLGGVIIWLLNEGATDPNTGRNPLLDAVKHGLSHLGPAPAPQLASVTGTITAVSTLLITGLSPSLGQVDIRWWNGTTTSFDEAVGNYGAYGLPSEYYIEASTNGSSWVALQHVINNTVNAGQLAADFTGFGYTQVRLRVVSIVGSYAGTALLTVNSAPSNIADSYLLLGDSITTNCWQTAADGYPTEQFGTQIHVADSTRFPVATQGGIPGLASADPLSTIPYSVPVIQKWLSEFPAVKYVGLSYGTNDANEGIAASTYCSNMKSLVQYVIAAGKTPIIPTIVGSPAATVQANAPAMNACLATLKQNYPSIISGPDLWTLFEGHSIADGWFFDSLHPSLGKGCKALQNAWTSSMWSAIYH